MDKVIIYNPRTMDGKPSQPIFNYPEMGKKWSLGVNKIGKFPVQVAEKLLKTFGFLQKIEPEGVSQVMEEMKAKLYTCGFCKESFTSAVKLQGHKMGKHKLSKETEAMLGDIPEAQGEDVPQAMGVKVAPALSPEQLEGIPDTSKGEVDGWYGGGLETENLSMRAHKPGEPGRFS